MVAARMETNRFFAVTVSSAKLIKTNNIYIQLEQKRPLQFCKPTILEVIEGGIFLQRENTIRVDALYSETVLEQFTKRQ